MSATPMHDSTDVWNQVRQWPPCERLALATRILQSLQQEDEAVSMPKKRKEALETLIGIWKTYNPPSAEEVELLVEEQRLTKHG